MLQDETDLSEMRLDHSIRRVVKEIQEGHPIAVIDIEESLPPTVIESDEMLGSIFRNLLKNAVLHNDNEIAEITDSAESTGETVAVRIIDNGPWIPNTQ